MNLVLEREGLEIESRIPYEAISRGKIED